MHRGASMMALWGCLVGHLLCAQPPQPSEPSAPSPSAPSPDQRITVKKVALPPLTPQAFRDPGPLSSLVEAFGDVSFEIPADASVPDLVRYMHEAAEISDQLATDYRRVQTGLARAQAKAAEEILSRQQHVSDKDFYLAARLAMSQRISQLVASEPQQQQQTVQLILRQLQIGTEQGLKIDEVRNALRAAAYMERFGDRTIALESCAAFARVIRQSESTRYQDALTQLDDVCLRLQLIGKPLSLVGKSIDGRTIDLAQFRGKVVLVHFWASDNATSLAEIPLLKRIYESNRGRGFEIVAISLDRNRAALESVLAEKQVPWTNLFDDSEDASRRLESSFGVRTVPASILLDVQGNVVTTTARSADLLPVLDRLLPQNEQSPDERRETPDGSASPPTL